MYISEFSECIAMAERRKSSAWGSLISFLRSPFSTINRSPESEVRLRPTGVATSTPRYEGHDTTRPVDSGHGTGEQDNDFYDTHEVIGDFDFSTDEEETIPHRRITDPINVSPSATINLGSSPALTPPSAYKLPLKRQERVTPKRDSSFCDMVRKQPSTGRPTKGSLEQIHVDEIDQYVVEQPTIKRSIEQDVRPKDTSRIQPRKYSTPTQNTVSKTVVPTPSYLVPNRSVTKSVGMETEQVSPLSSPENVRRTVSQRPV